MGEFQRGVFLKLGAIKDHLENHYVKSSFVTNTQPDCVIQTERVTQTECDYCKLVLAIDKSIFLKDGKRRIDFVLVWRTPHDDDKRKENDHKRKIFERNLEEEDLVLEREEVNNGLNFVKIHAPVNVLKEFTEILQFRMPLKEKVKQDDNKKTEGNSFVRRIQSNWNTFMNKFKVDPKLLPQPNDKLTDIYTQEKENLFDVDNPCFWMPAMRSRIVQFILDLTETEKDNDKEFGINRLIYHKTDSPYCAAYPLHDGNVKMESMRYKLSKEWASVTKCLKFQPLDCIKDYFGVKVGLYFAWLGFYTSMLVPASLAGLITYFAATPYSKEPSKDVCNSSVKMCPICDYFCEYWDIKDTCQESRMTYRIDNATTVPFAIFMSFWVAIFLARWKHYSAYITHRWDLTGFDEYEEHPRTQFLEREADLRNKPKTSFWMKLKPALISYSVISLAVVFALAAVVGMELYRMSMLGAKFLRINNYGLITSNPVLFTSITAGCINLVLIYILSYVYDLIAKWLTERECRRTQTEFEDSLSLKLYLLEFVNCYASIFYIAFFKGKFLGWPGKYYRIFGHRQEECSPGGCLLELSVQLHTVVFIRQLINSIKMEWPWLRAKWNARLLKQTNRQKRPLQNSEKCSFQDEEEKPLQYVEDFKLSDFNYEALFPEYLEQVLQFGFVTIFVAAFPLAPLIALIHNVFEIRSDAKKFLLYFRRPVPRRVTDIGIWYRIMDFVGRLSILTNGLIIAFTSEFIPRAVYNFLNGNVDDYMNSTLVQFNMSVLEYPPMGSVLQQNETCSFSVHNNYMPDIEDCEHSKLYWLVMAARFAFVVVFQNIVSLGMIIVHWVIPDIPSNLRAQIRKEAYQIKQVYKKHRAEKKGKAPQDSQQSGCQDGGKKDSNATIEHVLLSANIKYRKELQLDHEDLNRRRFSRADSSCGAVNTERSGSPVFITTPRSHCTLPSCETDAVNDYLSLEEHHDLRDVRVHLAKPESYFELEEYSKPDFLDLTTYELDNERMESPDDKSPLIDNTIV